MTRMLVVPLLVSALFVAAFAQTTSASPDARMLVSASIVAMGGTVPDTVSARGRVDLVIGSYRDSGTVRVLTRGLHQSREVYDVGGKSWEVVYSRGMAADVGDGVIRERSIELGSSGQTFLFPLPLLAGAAADELTRFEYVGTERLGDFVAHHVRFQRPTPRDARLAHLADLSRRDLWLDTSSLLPLKIAVTRKAADGAPGIYLETFYNDFRTIEGGSRFPYLVKQSVNGSPWTTVWMEQAGPATNLSDADFSAAGGQ